MREQAGASVGAAGDESAGGALFIITLSSSTTPMALDVPSLAELAGLAVFRSRKVEDGRDRFRLHLGYFESAAAAEHVLSTVREHFPAAWVGPAPNSGMGSLDDTSVAQFKFIKAPNTIKSDGGTSTRLRALTAAGKPAPVATRVAPSAAPTPALRPASPPKAAARSDVPTVNDVVTARMRPGQPTAARNRRSANARGVPSRLAAAMKAASPAKASLPAKVSPAKVSPAKAPAPKANASTRSSPAPARQVVQPAHATTAHANPTAHPALAPKEVLNLLEGRSREPRATHQQQMQPRERAAVIGAIQRFAVQLIWSTDPLNLAEVPKLAIFDAYTLYKVQVDRAGRRWYGLRLGFFGDAVSARQVAIYARSDFSAAAVVPVSDRECDRAAQAAVKELPDLPPVPKAEVEMELVDLPRSAPKVDIGAEMPKARPVGVAAPMRSVRQPAPSGAPHAPAQAAMPPKAMPQVASPARQPPAAVQPPAQPEKQERTRRLKTTEDLAADLRDVEPDFDLAGGDDPMNDTGVRHLAIQVVSKNKSGLGKLFKRRR